MIGGLHASGINFNPPIRGSKRSRLGTRLFPFIGPVQQTPESVNSQMELESMSSDQQKAALAVAFSNNESSDGKRLPACQYRLKPAKSIGLPGILQDLFMPLLHTKLNFGFVSNTGINSTGVKNLVDNDPGSVANAAPTGNYRGIVMFKLRHTNPKDNRQADNAFNAKRLQIVSSSVVGGIETHFRRFASRPTFNQQPASLPEGTASGVEQQECHTLTSDEVTKPGFIRQLPMGTNLAHMEDHAWASSNFIPSASNASIGAAGTYDVVSSQVVIDPVGGSTTGTAGLRGASPAWNGTAPLIYQTATYPARLRDATMRIKDGILSLDLSNTSKTPCVIEFVVHDMNKTADDITTQTLMNEIYAGYDYYTRQSTNGLNLQDPTAGQPGGWQTFYDPTVPFLSVPKQHSKKIKPIAREVHRSNHVLAAGQSKTVKFKLGSMTYKLGSKSVNETTGRTDDPPSQSLYGTIPVKNENFGSLNFSLGHTGFQAFESMGFGTDTLLLQATPNTVPDGYGFWAGKTYSPSSIVCTGMYQEDYYPMYVHSTNRLQGNIGVVRPSGNTAAQTSTDPGKLGLTLLDINTQHISVTQNGDQGRLISGNAQDTP